MGFGEGLLHSCTCSLPLSQLLSLRDSKCLFLQLGEFVSGFCFLASAMSLLACLWFARFLFCCPLYHPNPHYGMSQKDSLAKLWSAAPPLTLPLSSPISQSSDISRCANSSRAGLLEITSAWPVLGPQRQSLQQGGPWTPALQVWWGRHLIRE